MPRSSVDTADVPFPIKGLNTETAAEAQPKGTTPDAVNVRAYDPRSGPAIFIQHAGGNVCVIPRKQVEEIPVQVRTHIEESILPQFRMNAYTLQCLRELYENDRISRIRKKLGMEPHQDWRILDTKIKTTYLLAVAWIYREPWESPASFNPTPFPALHTDAFLFVYKQEKNVAFERMAWYKIVPRS
jgi:hypothetical protein